VIRAALFVFAFALAAPCASADEWSSRNGQCYEWEGFWQLDQQQQGLWNGNIDFTLVGAECAPPTGASFTSEAQAVIVGNVFFARRATAGSTCFMNGTVRADGVAGFEMCTSNPAPTPFAIRFRAPNRR
jgi:hypothetical protein